MDNDKLLMTMREAASALDTLQTLPNVARLLTVAADTIEAQAAELEARQVEPADGLGSGSITRLGLSTRPFNALMRAGITNIETLTALNAAQLRAVKNLGYSGVCDIRRCLARRGLCLRGEEPCEI